MRFTVIIPVYNVEKYIRKCMQTVMEQTFRDYEVIVVDDETPDNSMAIVEEFAEQYPGMIKMIHQKNTRQGGARNRGVQEAQGEYLLFVDSDDYVSTHLLETVDQHLRRNPCDILSFQYRKVTEDGNQLQIEGLGSLGPGRYVPEENKEILLLPVGPVFKAYRRAFYISSQFAFPEKVLYEDLMIKVLLAQAESVVLVEDCLYNYVQSGESSIRQKASRRMLDILTVTEMVQERFRELGLREAFWQPLEASLLYGITYILDIINLEDKNSALQVPIAVYLSEHFRDYRENPYIDPRQRRGMECLMNRDFVRYHYRVALVTWVKERLLGWKWVDQLNRLRWKLMKRFGLR